MTRSCPKQAQFHRARSASEKDGLTALFRFQEQERTAKVMPGTVMI